MSCHSVHAQALTEGLARKVPCRHSPSVSCSDPIVLASFSTVEGWLGSPSIKSYMPYVICFGERALSLAPGTVAARDSFEAWVV